MGNSSRIRPTTGFPFSVAVGSRAAIPLFARGAPAGVPTGPDEAVTASEGEPEPKIMLGLWVVGIGARRGVVEQVHDHLAATIGDVVDEHAAGSARIGPAPHEEIQLGLHQTSRLRRTLVEIGGDSRFRALRL